MLCRWEDLQRVKNVIHQYSHLIKERDETRRRINRINEELIRINEEGNVKDSVKGGYGNTQTFYIEGFPVAREDQLKYQLAKQKQILELRECEINDITNELEEQLNGIDDSMMRRLITKRLIEEKPWNVVAGEMGPRYTEEGCRKLLERYLKKIEE